MDALQQYSTFVLDGFLFGVEVRQVQEVLPYQEMTRVPLAPPVIQGLINLRGQIVTAMDLRRRLGLSARPVDRSPMNVVLRSDEGAISLLVDEIGEVLEVSEETFELPPRTLQGKVRDMIRGAYKLDDRLMVVLDVEKTLRLPTSSRDTGE